MKNILRKFTRKNRIPYSLENDYEYCKKCDANLTLQKGYRPDLPYWICKGCGMMLINPRVSTDTDIVWICDQCQALLNDQPGFHESCGRWQCTACGYENPIDVSQVYLSEDEYQSAAEAPYHGLSDEDMLTLMSYEEIGEIDGREDVVIVKDEAGNLYVKKILATFDESIYQYLMKYPISHMPRIISTYRGESKLIVIEQWIDGITIDELLQSHTIKEKEAVHIVRDVCRILKELHNPEHLIIHRDIKPSNVMLSPDGSVYLLDVNAAKWYKPEEVEDTKLLGTLYYAAPEQLGYGFASSTEKTDIYAVGMLLNKMITGKFPKEERADGAIWDVICKCISLNPEDRYSDEELIDTLNEYLREKYE